MFESALDMSFSDNIIELFQRNRYETHVLNIMNRSKAVFPLSYRAVTDQSHGECDFISEDQGDGKIEKFDAKLPYKAEQISLLTNGKMHPPRILEWLQNSFCEISRFDLNTLRTRGNAVAQTELYQIMKKQIEEDKPDESIIFFFPIPVSIWLKDAFVFNETVDNLRAIYETLTSEIDLQRRKIYCIYPSPIRKEFVARNLSDDKETEGIDYPELENYFSIDLLE